MAAATAMLIAAGISAAGSVAASKISSDAAKKAAKTQTEAAREAAQVQTDSAKEALALQERMYQQTRSDLEPYRTVGGQAVTTLGSLMGLGGGGGATGAATSTAPTLSALAAPTTTAYGGARERNATAITGRAVQRDAFGTDQAYLEQGDTRADRQARQEAAGARSLAGVAGSVDPSTPAAQRTSGYVAMRAPTGEIQAVPASQIAHYRALGASLA